MRIMDLRMHSSSFKKCAYCGYQSDRSYNVFRHEDRIHARPKHCRDINCCNRRFLTKGEFYAHVESTHPETRKGYVSRTKYKIVKPLLNCHNLKVRRCKTNPNKPSLRKRKATLQDKKKRTKIAPIMERKRSLRIQEMEYRKKHPVNLDIPDSEDIPLKKKSEVPKVLEESAKPVFQRSLKRKFEEIRDANDNNFINENNSSNNVLPLKKRILRELQENQLPEEVQEPKKNSEQSKENLCPEVLVEVNLDPNILWPQTQQVITEYLSDITFELFKIETPNNYSDKIRAF